MRRLLIIPVAACLVAGPVLAHDFWLQPQAFWTRPGVAVPMILLVGHGAARQRSSIAKDRITQFRASGPGGIANRMGDLTLGSAADASLSFSTPGTFLVYFSTSNIPSDLPAKRFNEYAAAEGLDPILARRAASESMNKPGRELYSRRGKAIVQVGPAGNVAQPQITRPVGLGLEIVPLSNPYTSGNSATMTVQVLYQGRPLSGALVKLNNLAADAQPVEMHRSDAAGRATFRARRAGQWQFNVVWSQPLANNATADFLTTFSSLTFGFLATRSVR
jgi:uncharacterized GH25 family protein